MNYRNDKKLNSIGYDLFKAYAISASSLMYAVEPSLADHVINQVSHRFLRKQLMYLMKKFNAESEPIFRVIFDPDSLKRRDKCTKLLMVLKE